MFELLRSETAAHITYFDIKNVSNAKTEVILNTVRVSNVLKRCFQTYTKICFQFRCNNDSYDMITVDSRSINGFLPHIRRCLCSRQVTKNTIHLDYICGCTQNYINPSFVFFKKSRFNVYIVLLNQKGVNTNFMFMKTYC